MEPRRLSGSSKIDKVDPIPSGPVAGPWVPVIRSFNPLGPIAEAYAKYLAYCLESKRLQLEERRIREQATVLNKAIDAGYSLKMEDLKQRRIAIERYFDTVQQQLDHLHIERMAVLDMAKLAGQKALELGISLDERRCYTEMNATLVSQLPRFGDQANASLATLIKALPFVSIPDNLLPGRAEE